MRISSGWLGAGAVAALCLSGGYVASGPASAFERVQSRPIPGGHRGPGLGLSIVKSFVELHDGQVSLLSKVNQGTTVLCTFPIDGPSIGQRNMGMQPEARRLA